MYFKLNYWLNENIQCNPIVKISVKLVIDKSLRLEQIDSNSLIEMLNVLTLPVSYCHLLDNDVIRAN